MSNQDSGVIDAVDLSAEASTLLTTATPTEEKTPWFVRLALWLVQKVKNLVTGYYFEISLFGWKLRIGRVASGDWGFALKTKKALYRCTTGSIMELYQDLKDTWAALDAQP
jgi:hypothetical protein